MEEIKNKFPPEYIEEAVKLKNEYMKKWKEHIENSKGKGNKGRDFGAKEERKINQEFSRSLKKLQEKYNI